MGHPLPLSGAGQAEEGVRGAGSGAGGAHLHRVIRQQPDRARSVDPRAGARRLQVRLRRSPGGNPGLVEVRHAPWGVSLLGQRRAVWAYEFAERFGCSTAVIRPLVGLPSRVGKPGSSRLGFATFPPPMLSVPASPHFVG